MRTLRAGKFLAVITMSTVLVACGDEASESGDEHVLRETSMHNDTNVGAVDEHGTGNTGACTDDTWENYAQQFFANNCSTCHKTWFTAYADLAPKSQRVEAAIESGRMPKRRTLDDGEKTRILRWLRCGMPE